MNRWRRSPHTYNRLPGSLLDQVFFEMNSTQICGNRVDPFLPCSYREVESWVTVASIDHWYNVRQGLNVIGGMMHIGKQESFPHPDSGITSLLGSLAYEETRLL